MLAVLALASSTLIATAAAPSCSVAIDIGHCRELPGVTSARGVAEWEFNRALALALDEALRDARVRSFVIDASGECIPLVRRTEISQERGATLLISLHHDSVQPRYLSRWRWRGEDRLVGDRFRGFSLFVSARNRAFEESVEAAAAIADGLLAAGHSPSRHHAEAIPGENRPVVDGGRGIYRHDDLVVLKHARIPAVLVEAAVIVNRQDELLAASHEYRQSIARAATAAALAHCARVGSRAAGGETGEAP